MKQKRESQAVDSAVKRDGPIDAFPRWRYTSKYRLPKPLFYVLRINRATIAH